MNKEVEVFGVTYDRYVLLQHQQILAKELKLNTVVEIPSHGAKAAGSLYSIGFAVAGCRVTLINPEPAMMSQWDHIALRDRVQPCVDINIYETPFSHGQFDLAWNFVTWTEVREPLRLLHEMKRIAARHVLLVTCNNLQAGYLWHRVLHWLFGFPWTHGQVQFNHLPRVKMLFRQAGMNVLEYGAIDTPGWPDPSGPRDVRLHRRFGEKKSAPEWRVPMMDYVKTGNYPAWMQLLGKWDMAFRKGGWKLPLSHLFYVLGSC